MIHPSVVVPSSSFLLPPPFLPSSLLPYSFIPRRGRTTEVLYPLDCSADPWDAANYELLTDAAPGAILVLMPSSF